MTMGTHPDSSPAADSIEQLAVNTIRTLSMDAVQAANSGHPGTPMALAPVAYRRHCHVSERWRPGKIGGVRTATASYKGHRYPVEIINHCVWLYFRFSLSFREVEELMLVRGGRGEL